MQCEPQAAYCCLSDVACKQTTAYCHGLEHTYRPGLAGMQGMDAYDFSDPLDILPSLDKAFWDGLAAVKWTERRDALRSLRQLASAPRLASGDYADVSARAQKGRAHAPFMSNCTYVSSCNAAV